MLLECGCATKDAEPLSAVEVAWVRRLLLDLLKNRHRNRWSLSSESAPSQATPLIHRGGDPLYTHSARYDGSSPEGTRARASTPRAREFYMEKQGTCYHVLASIHGNQSMN